MRQIAYILSFYVIQNVIFPVSSYCWTPNINPFTGPPDTERLEGSTVRVTWENVFPHGPGCGEVEFLIKSHPLDSPSNYKLSDLTLKGKRTAVLAVPPGEDFIFQVIARENKGPGIGIEYAYSRAATSVANPTPSQVQGLRQSIWVAGDTGSGNVRPSQHQNYRPAPTTTTAPPPPTTTSTQRTYLRPSVRSLSLGGGPPYTSRLGNGYSGYGQNQQSYQNDNYNFGQADEIQKVEEETGATGPWYVYECIPLLKNLAGFEEGSKRNSILTQFIKHMNKNAVGSVKNFITSNKSCGSGYEGKERGHLVATQRGDNKCCTTPWPGDFGQANHDVCYDQFARCDGRCIPHDWVSDGWPDCMDGADEASLAVDGKVMPYQLGCVQCAGVVLSASFLCLESQSGLTRQCVESLMGPGECNVCIEEFLSLQ